MLKTFLIIQMLSGTPIQASAPSMAFCLQVRDAIAASTLEIKSVGCVAKRVPWDWWL